MSAEFWRSLRRGFDSLTLGPTSPVLEELRRDAERRRREARARLLEAGGLTYDAYPCWSGKANVRVPLASGEMVLSAELTAKAQPDGGRS